MYRKYLYKSEEKQAAKDFTKNFRQEVKIVRRALNLMLEMISTSSTKPNEFHEYSAILLATTILNGFLSSLDRLEKGYTAESETLLKRILEGLLAQLLLYKNPVLAKQWCEGTKVNQLYLNGTRMDRKQVALELDRINKETGFFPTNMENYFEKIVYDAGYSSSNDVAHLDFYFVHRERGEDSKSPDAYATQLYLGPRFDKKLASTMINRLIIYSLTELTTLLEITKFQNVKRYENLFKNAVLLREASISSMNSS